MKEPVEFIVLKYLDYLLWPLNYVGLYEQIAVVYLGNETAEELAVLGVEHTHRHLLSSKEVY
jgi:hypothetical protein